MFQVYGGSCCVAREAAWLLGGQTSPSTRAPRVLYSWDGPGQPWRPHPPYPGQLGVLGSLVFDEQHSLSALGGYKQTGVWRFDLPSDQWTTLRDQPRWKQAPGSLCGHKFIVQPGGEGDGERGTASILLLDITTGDYTDSPTSLRHSVRSHCAVAISRTN